MAVKMDDINELKKELTNEAIELIEGLDNDTLVLMLMNTDEKITNICNLFDELRKEVYNRGSKEEHRKFLEGGKNDG